jgi:protein-S-isoprenylcysteine O-methyltransferase Ste14
MTRQFPTALIVAYGVWWAFFISWVLAGRWSSNAAARPKGAREQPYVWLNAIGFAMIFWPRTPVTRPLWINPPEVEWVMIALMLVGFAFCWWARLHLGRLWSATVTRKDDHRIIDTGPYALVRHPIYTGLILSGLTLAVLGASALHIIGAAIFTFSWFIKARLEETFLSEELGPETYAAYRRRVPMLVPFLPAPGGAKT